MDCGDFLSGPEHLTVSLWVKFTGTTDETRQYVASHMGSWFGAERSWSLGLTRQPPAETRILVVDSGGNGDIFMGSKTLEMDKWYFYTFVWDSGTAIGYVNGEKDSSTTLPQPNLGDSTYPIRIAKWEEGFTNGIITIVRVYLIAKSASWIEQRFERTKGIFGV